MSRPERWQRRPRRWWLPLSRKTISPAAASRASMLRNLTIEEYREEKARAVP